MDTVSLDSIILRIDLHLRSHVVELHIVLPDPPTVLDGFNPFLEVVGGDCAGVDGSFGDEEDGCLRDQWGEHGARDNGLDGGD